MGPVLEPEMTEDEWLARFGRTGPVVCMVQGATDQASGLGRLDVYAIAVRFPGYCSVPVTTWNHSSRRATHSS